MPDSTALLQVDDDKEAHHDDNWLMSNENLFAFLWTAVVLFVKQAVGWLCPLRWIVG